MRKSLTGILAKLYLKSIRDHCPDMVDLVDDTLLRRGNAFCAARGQALADQAKTTMKELGTTPKQTARIVGTAHGCCRY
ncbi:MULTISPECIES: hypothetical protein [Streptomyces]|uniref:hypothetical protein n=1 Tax=Streptomyces TaxID=1883 RepID=UPI001E412BC2|nr:MULTISPECIES: hypothetical protein [Streptomyces]UFQ13755.1 hypothetical protein J2N69_01260 [Streptomyces huasconensis]WCL83350.1 hypothetical protein PPN52_01245 [Streptomyces sp. JCM 35825]